jgi:hypothetical protein
MAIPSVPTNFSVQTQNTQNLVVWNLTPTATSYTVQRSLDGITYVTISSPTLPSYLDITVTSGLLYYYQVAAVNISGPSAFTTPQSVVPAPVGELSLLSIRTQSRQRADRVNSNVVTDAEWNNYIAQSYYELYDLLVTVYDDYFLAPGAQFVTDGTTQFYPLPDGFRTFKNYTTQATYVAPSFYKLLGVDLALSTAQNAQTTMAKFNFEDRNKFLYPNSASTIYGVFNMQYRVMGNTIEFIPVPTANQPITLWYIPRLSVLLQDTDVTTLGFSGWIEYVIMRSAYLALMKEESLDSANGILMQLQAMQKRIEETASNRDAGRPDTITDVRSGYLGENGSGWNGRMGGF